MVKIFEMVKRVIESRDYKLRDLLDKIEKASFEGRLTLEEKETLDNLARKNADFHAEVGILEKLDELDARISALEKTATVPSEEFPEYVAGTWYKAGAKVTFEGKHYECIAPADVTCVWSPTEYDSYWKLLA